MSSTAQTLAPQVRRRKHARFGPHRLRMAFRRWRRSRPFWAGLLVLIGGAIITLGPATAYKVILSSGDVVWEGIVVGALITVLGFFFWYQPAMRHFFGVLVVMLSVLSFITSDIGGFLVGMTLAMTGGAMGFAWVPVDPATVKPHVWRREERKAWRRRQQLERRARRARWEQDDEEAVVEIPVSGVPVEEPAVEVPAIEVPAHEVERQAEPVTGVIETTGEEVDRLPKAGAAVDGDAPPPASRRRFPFGTRDR